MKLVNTPKLAFSIVAALCITVLMVTGSVESSEGVPFLTMLAGYILGNGVAARKGDPVQPIIGGKDS